MSKKQRARTPRPRGAATAPAVAARAPRARDGGAGRRARAGLMVWIGLGAAVAAAVAAVYANSLANGFVFDDGDLVLGDPRIRSLSLASLVGDSYRPLRTLTYAIDYAVWGLNPTGFRITNIAIHAANCALALALARRLTGGARLASLAATLVFALHPVQVESVAYISGRRDVLFALFYLAAFLAYANFREAATRARRAAWLAAAAAGFGLSLMAKEMAASLPVLCLLWDVYRASAPDERGAAPSPLAVARRVAREGALLYAAGAVALAAFAYYTLVVRGATTRVAGTDVEFWGGSALNNLLTVPLTYAHYAKLTVWPATLAAQYYGAFDPAGGLADPRVVPALLFLIGLCAAAAYLILRTSHRLAGFGVAWFVVTLLPASQIIPHHEIVADHYLYLPLAGAGLALAGALLAAERLAGGRWRPAAYGAAALAVALLAAATVARNREWRDEQTLWEATYRDVPESPRAAYNYGLVLTGRNQHERAVELYREAIDGDPTFAMAYFNLASTYAGLGRFEEARGVYRAALSGDVERAARRWHTTPEVLRAMYEVELALLDTRSGRAEAGRDALAALVARYPNLLRAVESYAALLETRGELRAEIGARRARVEADPASHADRLVLASLLWRVGQLDEASRLFARALEAEPDGALANLHLARYYGEIRPGAAPSPGAVADHFERAERGALTPFDAEAVRRARRGAAAGTLAG